MTVCSLALAFAQPSTLTSAQPAAPSAESDARLVAATVQSFYEQTKDVSASFYQTYVNKLYQRTDRTSGRVVFKKPGKMRWDYDKPNGKVIVSNGSRAPRVNDSIEASAACHGLVRSSGSIPSSASACAPRASCSVSC